MVGETLLFAGKVLAAVVSPLAFAMAGLLVGIVIWRRAPRLARVTIVLALVALWLAATPVIARWLTWSLERQSPSVAVAQSPTADVAIVLGGAVRTGIHPSDGPALSAASARVLHAARLLRAGRVKSILIVGGNLPWLDDGPPEAKLIRDLLREWGVADTAIRAGGSSRNTYENALEARRLLQEAGYRRALLVTSAAHMPRALAVFRRAGVTVIASPTDFRAAGNGDWTVLDVLPSAGALAQTSEACREWLGIAVYWWRGWL